MHSSFISEFITWLTIGPQPTDTTTLIPFLESMEKHLNFKYLKIVADVGYESEENYSYIENMDYNYAGDYYICKNNKKLSAEYTKVRKSKTGYVSKKTIYVCEDCSNCEFKSKYIKGHNCKTPLE